MQAINKQAHRIFKERNGTLRTSEALRAGIHPRSLYGMRDRGEVEQIARGLFRLAELPPPGEPDLLTVAKKVPQAVFCLLTALAFHRLTTQIPHAVEVALPRTARAPRLDHPPLKVFRFSPESLSAGIETHVLDGVSIRIYCREKTLADIFKYRNKVGLDVALEALRAYRSQSKRDFQTVLKYARICRVENVIRPYLEATL
ncbi:MAG: type IV toxin-antitoxin system AbiEi family antitoxin domain-containing protein [Phycisphaerae bacterium]|jgi:predicted transcriptional regulator of viral defense system